MTKKINTSALLAALNTFRVADGKEPIAKWKKDRHEAALAAYKKAAGVTTPRVTMSHAPSAEPKPLRKGTNQAVLAQAMLTGVTMDEAVRIVNDARRSKDKAASLLDKSVIGATMSYDLTKVKGYGVEARLVDNVPTYFLVLPKGMDAPVIK